MPYSSGRHGGCRPRFGADGYVWVGTGDAAIGTTPQDDDSLGGKVLRIDRDGAAAPGNPGATFLEGGDWGDWTGALAVAILKAEHLHIYFVSAGGEVTDDFRVIEDQGRLRSSRQGPDGLLYVTTDGSGSGGQVLRATPAFLP